MNRQHHYKTTLTWTGNRGSGTREYRGYERSHTITVDNKPDILCSSDPAFRGDRTRYNPEELLVASLSGCHMLWFLHLCADNGIIVTAYTDNATGIMEETEDGGGRFTGVILRPAVTITEDTSVDRLMDLHQKANKLCFIANSCNFPVKHEPVHVVAELHNS